MTRDVSVNTILGVLFGIGGIATLVFTWVQVMPTAEGITATSIGSIGVFWTLIGGLLLKYKRADK